MVMLLFFILYYNIKYDLIIYSIMSSEEMDRIQAVKEIRGSGSSCAIYITRELGYLGLTKGDKVKITLEKI